MGITGRIGLWAACFLGLVHGSMGPVDSLDTWTTGMTLATVTTDPCLNGVLSSSTTSMAMRRGMDGVMKDRLRTARRGSMRCRGITVAVAMRADTTRSGLTSWFPTHAQKRLRMNGKPGLRYE